MFQWQPGLVSHGVWRSMVARLFWEQEIVSSNPATPAASYVTTS